ncbi:MAG: alpha/beta hydrolase [Bdellovibrionaceae bacterium]|nr:alpha/beta hydrolase [Pseudobdellovibrionaceae bacterium]
MKFQIPHAEGRELNYEVYPNQLPEATLFLHGNLASNRWWTPVREAWSGLGPSKAFAAPMIVAEFRGCGDSTAPASLDEVNMELFARDFLALVKGLNVGPVNVVGHSTGGLIAAHMAAIDPTLVNKIVLLDPVGARGVKFEESMTAAFEAMKKDRALTAVVIGSTIHNNDADRPFFKNEITDDAYKAVSNVGAWVLQSLDGFDSREALKSVKAPALVLHGEFDTLLPRADSEELAQILGGRFQELKGCGHCANLENPRLFAEVAHSFLFAGR